MATRQVSEFPSITNVDGEDLVHIKTQFGIDNKVKAKDLLKSTHIARNYDTLALMQADIANLQIGETCSITERTTGNGGGANWKVVDATTVTENEIDIVTGSAAISFQIIDKLPLDVRTYGASTSLADNQSITQRIADRQIKSVYFAGSGSYKYLTPVTFSYDVEIFADPAVTIDEGAGFVGTNVFKFVGDGLTQIAELNANVTRGDTSFTFASAITLVKDDIFAISNPTNSSWSGFRVNYKAGEYCEVHSVSGNTVTLKKPLYDSYVAANVDVYSQSSITPNIHDITINGDVAENVIALEFCRNAKITNVKSSHSNNAILSEVNCYNTEIRNPAWSNVGDGGDDYGWVSSNSQHSRMFGGKVHARRHSVAMGGGVGTAVVPSRDIKIIGSTLSNDPSSNVHNADFHGHSEQCEYVDCTIYGGATWQGKDNGYNNCEIYNFLEGVCILGSEILGGRHYATDCRLRTNIDPFTGSRGVIDIGGNSDAITANTVEDVTIDLKGITLSGTNLTASTSPVIVRNRGTTNKINVDIDGMTLNVNNFGQALFMDNVSGTAASDYIVVDNVKTSLNGKLLANIDANYLAFPMRMQEFTASEEVTLSIASSTKTGTATSYKFIYPKIPHVTMSRSARGYAGNRIGIAYADPISATTLTPNISTDDATNFASAVTVTLNWSVGIKEV